MPVHRVVKPVSVSQVGYYLLEDSYLQEVYCRLADSCLVRILEVATK